MTCARWAQDENGLKTLQARAKFFGLDKTENFEDFKAKFLKVSNNPLDNSKESAIMQLGGIFKRRFDELTIEARKTGAEIERGAPDAKKFIVGECREI